MEKIPQAKYLSVFDKFENKEVRSTRGYFSGYKPKGITEQTNRLRELFPGLGFVNFDYQKKVESGEIKPPDGTEGWFAIPNWQKNEKIFGKTYSEAVCFVLALLKRARAGRFFNYHEGQITETQLRQSVESQKFWAALAEAQGNPDILIVPAQFGIRHRGRSVHEAREVFALGEFGLGAFAIGIMILTHPERLLKNYDDLWINCPGDESDYPDPDGRFVGAPHFKFHDGRVKFGTAWCRCSSGNEGSASGFVPQN